MDEAKPLMINRMTAKVPWTTMNMGSSSQFTTLTAPDI
jgi:hypothetical protein